MIDSLPKCQSHHFKDHDGNPAGGHTYGPGFAIAWQNGPRGGPGATEMVAPNGAYVETIIEAALDRLRWFETSRFACDENKLAITHLTLALERMNHRRSERMHRGVLGSHSL